MSLLHGQKEVRREPPEEARVVATDRPSQVAGALTAAVSSALVLFLLQTVLAFVNGELSWVLQRQGGAWVLSILGGRSLLFAKAFEILFWDLGLFLAAMVVLHRREWLTPALEALAAFSFCLLLWRQVFLNLGMIAFPSWVVGEISRTPGVWETLFFMGILGLGKEAIFRRLNQLDRELDSPLLAVFAWTHRKDAVFNILFGLTVLGAAAGLPAERLFMVFAFVKILLLGSASFDISGRCLRRLIPEGAEIEPAEEDRL